MAKTKTKKVAKKKVVSSFDDPDYFFKGPESLKGQTLTIEFDGEARSGGKYNQLTFKEKPYHSVSEFKLDSLEDRNYDSVWLGHFTEDTAYGPHVTINGSTGLRDSCTRKQIFRVKKIVMEVEVVSSELHVQENGGMGRHAGKMSLF